MTNRSTDTSLRGAALAAGFGLLLMTICAVFAEFFVFQKLIVPGNAATTAQNITAGETLFRAGVGAFLIVILCDVVVAWALYVYLKPANPILSLLAGWLRLVYAVMFGVALANTLGVLRLLHGAPDVTALEPAQMHARVMLLLNAFRDGWAVGFVFFGFHLGVVGYLAFTSGYIPRGLGVLLMIAGAGYLIDNFGKSVVPAFDVSVSAVTGWGELLFMFWLLSKGVSAQPPQGLPIGNRWLER